MSDSLREGIRALTQLLDVHNIFKTFRKSEKKMKLPRKRLLPLALLPTMISSFVVMPTHRYQHGGIRSKCLERKNHFPIAFQQQQTLRPQRRTKNTVITTSSSYSSSQLHLGGLELLPHDLLLAQQEVIQSSATNILDQYLHLLKTAPITTKAITAAILACTGDAIAQFRSEAEAYDPKRGVGFLLFGALYTGAFQHVWFNYLSQNIADWGDILGIWGPPYADYPLDQVIDATEWWRYFDIAAQLAQPPSPQMLAAAKVVLNQLLVIPVVYMPLFFAFTGLVAGLDVNESMARAQNLYLPLLRRNWFYWLPVQFLQFLVIPVDLQIPFVSAASLVWTIILSSVGGAASAPAPISSIVSYETEVAADGEEIVTMNIVDPGPANEITDDVTLKDIENLLIPEDLVDTLDDLVGTAKEVTSDPRTSFATSGLAVGLLTAAAEEGAIGAAIGNLVGGETAVGIAVATAVGAGIGLIGAAMKDAANATDTDDSYWTEEEAEQLALLDVNATAINEQLVDTDIKTIDINTNATAIPVEENLVNTK